MSEPLTARPATWEDADWLLRLRNDVDTVAGALVSRAVGGEEHRAWLGTVLGASSRRLMIVGSATAPSLATYRLDYVGAPTVEISLTVAPEARGLGLAVPVIRLASAHAVREGASVMFGIIKRDNARSLRAFARAGFVAAPELNGSLLAGCEVVAIPWGRVAGWRCAACARDVPHHTNSLTSIGRPGLRYPIYDLHEEPDGAYGFLTYECDAGDMLLAWEQAQRRRLGLPEPNYSIRETVLPEEGR